MESIDKNQIKIDHVQKLKIATWNVNSMNVRKEQVVKYLTENNIDILAVQELKGVLEKFPFDLFAEHGYQAIVNAQPTYNGVAFIYKKKLVDDDVIDVENSIHNNPLFIDEQKRLITLEIKNVCTLICAYIPNGESLTSEKFTYKMKWLEALHQYLKDLQAFNNIPLVLLGDYNITIDDRDLFDPIGWQDGIHCSETERQFFKDLNALNMLDVLRHLDPVTPTLFTWWDYRLNSFRRNRGLRIDHIFAEESLLPLIDKAYINREPRTWERPSDHVPVVFELKI